MLDGWWYEGYREGAGWALTDKRTYQNQEHQDQLDATTIYNLLEHEILPLYYNKNEKGYSEGWVRTIKNSIAQIAPHYTMKRQLDDYFTRFYCPMAARKTELVADNCKKAKEIALWKEIVAQRWDGIHVVSSEREEALGNGLFVTGKNYLVRHVIDEQGLEDAVGVELVTTYVDEKGDTRIKDVQPMNVVKKDGNLYTFEAEYALNTAGSFKIAYRMYPKNVDLPHRQDFCYVKWFI